MNGSKDTLSVRILKIATGPLASVLVYILAGKFNSPLVHMGAITACVTVWWLTEFVPISISSLLPLIALPVAGILSFPEAGIQYFDKIIFLFAGGFVIALAIEKFNLHRRIALKILVVVGSRPINILAGIMITTFLLSMWVSNTATVMMMLSAVLAIVLEMEKIIPDKNIHRKISSGILIGLAYSATIGGMGTLVGTPTNLIFLNKYNELFPDQTDMNFLKWFVVAFPFALIFLLAAFLVIAFYFFRNAPSVDLGRNYFKGQLIGLGKITRNEQVVGSIFILTAVLWLTRGEVDFEGFIFPGWQKLLAVPKIVDDSFIAVFMALLLLIIPESGKGYSPMILPGELKKIPFDVLLLFGGGFALAKGFDASGLSKWIALKLHFISDLDFTLFLILVLLLITLISEFASNVACITLMIPVLMSIEFANPVHPLLILIPATLAASLGFMLPIATAPNTIVYGSRKIRSAEMMTVGFVLDIVGIILITLFSFMI